MTLHAIFENKSDSVKLVLFVLIILFLWFIGLGLGVLIFADDISFLNPDFIPSRIGGIDPYI